MLISAHLVSRVHLVNKPNKVVLLMAVYIELTEYQKLHIGSYDMKKQTNKQLLLSYLFRFTRTFSTQFLFSVNTDHNSTIQANP